MYATMLRWYLERMSLEELSITGGEPALSPAIGDVLGVLADFDLKVVMTSNGTGLFKLIPELGGIVDHINVSRHSVHDSANRIVFRTDSVPDTEGLTHICQLANNFGIDVTLNRVVEGGWDNGQSLLDYVNLAKKVGASAVTIRKDYRGDSLEMTPLEANLNLKGKTRSCPVCVTTTYLIEGMPVHFKRSLEETDSQGIHEYIYHPDGRLTSDWAGERPVDTLVTTSQDQMVRNLVELTTVSDRKIRVADNGSCSQGRTC